MPFEYFKSADMSKSQEQLLIEILEELSSIRKAMFSVEEKLSRLNLNSEAEDVIDLSDMENFTDEIESERDEAEIEVKDAEVEQDAVEDVLVEEEDVELDIFGMPVQRKIDINEKHSRTRQKSIGETMMQHESWRTAIPGSAVSDVRSAISLNDRILFVRELFDAEQENFYVAVSAINAMTDFEEAVAYLSQNYPSWDYEGETVYRFMMAVRRRFQ